MAKYRLELRFKRISGKIMIMNIVGVRPTLTGEEIDNAMTSIIDNYVLIPSNDKLVEKLSASIIMIEKNDD